MYENFQVNKLTSQENLFYCRLHLKKFSSQQKIFFECSVIVQNPVQTILGVRTILEFFSQKFEIFVFSTPHTA